MLRQLLNSADLNSTIIILLLEIPVILISLSLHELSHGYMAYRCGDGTAKSFGRLTLNPIKHLDVIGTLFMFLFGFGWAKPVPVNTRNLRKPKRDMALVSLAGPVSNLLLAFLFAAVYMLMWKVSPEDALSGIGLVEVSAVGLLTVISYLGVILNVGLAMFNLIPIPPLDGSNILLSLLPQRLAVRYVNIRRYTQYIFLGIVVLSWISPNLFNMVFAPFNWLCENITLLFCLPFKLLFTGEGEEIIYRFATWFIK